MSACLFSDFESLRVLLGLPLCLWSTLTKALSTSQIVDREMQICCDQHARCGPLNCDSWLLPRSTLPGQALSCHISVAASQPTTMSSNYHFLSAPSLAEAPFFRFLLLLLRLQHHHHHITTTNKSYTTQHPNICLHFAISSSIHHHHSHISAWPVEKGLPLGTCALDVPSVFVVLALQATYLVFVRRIRSSILVAVVLLLTMDYPVYVSRLSGSCLPPTIFFTETI